MNNSEAIRRKERTIQILKIKNIPYIEHLPVIEEENKITERTKTEIAKRAVACMIAIQMAIGHQRGFDNTRILEVIKKFDVETYLTNNEKNIIYGRDIKEQDIINMTWKYEAYWVLIWSLGLLNELNYPSEICDCNYAESILFKHDNFESFLDTCKLRNLSEILDEADLIYRYNWACVNARVSCEQIPSNLNPSIVLERHKALNWLVRYSDCDDWDNMPTDT